MDFAVMQKGEPMRLIDADKLKKDVLDLPNCYNGFSDTYDKACIIGVIEEQPTIEPERKKGMWTEKHHAYSDEESVIEEWQSCCCSECGRYDTRPYMYYFSEPNYCSYCGADMRSKDAD